LFIIADCTANNKRVAGKMAQERAFFQYADKAHGQINNIFSPAVDFSVSLWYITFCTPKGNAAG